MEKYTFLVNPKSRSGKGKVIWKLIEPELKKRRIPYQVFYTRYERHASELAHELTKDGQERKIVVLGGDGTISEVVSGITDNSKAVIGYIPTGSGNDFTRGAGLPTKPMEALENVLNPGKIQPLDIGVMENDHIKDYFIVSAGIGFDAAVCHQVAVSKAKVWLNRLHLGQLSYLVVALQILFAQKMDEMEVVLDGTEVRRFDKTCFVAVMNHAYEGGGFYFCPQAKADDGILDVIVVSGLSKWKILLLLPTAFKGKHVKYKGVDIFQCKNISVRAKSAQPIHTDGEPVDISRELNARIAKKKIWMMTP